MFISIEMRMAIKFGSYNWVLMTWLQTKILQAAVEIEYPYFHTGKLWITLAILNLIIKHQECEKGNNGLKENNFLILVSWVFSRLYRVVNCSILSYVQYGNLYKWKDRKVDGEYQQIKFDTHWHGCSSIPLWQRVYY